MGNQTSTQAMKSVSEIVNKSVNETSNSSEVKSDSEIFQDATIHVINKSSGTCKPSLNVILDQQATIASINNNESEVSQDVTSKIINQAEALAKQGNLQTQEGLFKLSNQNSKQTIEQIQKQKNEIENIVKNAMKSVIKQSASQKGVIEFTDEGHYQCYGNQDANKVPPVNIGVKHLANLVAENSSSSIVEALAKTDLKNVTVTGADQENDQSSKGLLSSLAGIFGQTFIIIAAVIGGICLLACVAMMLMGPSLSEMTDSVTTLAPLAKMA